MATYNVGNIEVGAVGNVTSGLQSLDKVINKLDEVKSNLTKSKSGTDKVNDSFNKLNNTVSKVSKSTSSLFNLGKLYFLINYSKRVIGSIVRIVQVASDYTEILNKFQVSFGDLYEQSIDYVNRLSKAYGMSKNTLMDYSSTFNNMLKSLKGLTDETSQRLSFTLTQLALDYSSLFNQSIESTMLAFQSMLSGQIRPIRSVSGIDTSETSIFAIYKELGGTKTMRQLNQLEKRLLRIIAVEQQMMKAGAIGDFARTINCSPFKKLKGKLFVNARKSGVTAMCCC